MDEKEFTVMPEEPYFGLTRHGVPVHRKVFEYHPVSTRYQRFNKRVAQWITKNVGTMTCFWLFSLLASLSLPATLVLVGWVPHHVSWMPAFFLSLGWVYLIQWVAQSYIQLVLLPGLMVGQALQNEAADARSAKQFEDVEALRADVTVALDRLDENTQGGIRTVLDAVKLLRSG